MNDAVNNLDATENVPGMEGYKFLNNRQTLYLGYMLCVLVDLVVLNLYVEFWDRVVIDSFLLSLFTACLLQLLLKITLKLEHRVAGFFKAKSGTAAQVMRWFSAWAIIFGSKFIMLWAVDLVFEDHVDFGGIVPFLIIIVSIILAELLVTQINRKLSDG